MSKCHACGVDLTFAINEKTGKRVPLVPFDPAYPNAVRYRLAEGLSGIAMRDEDGPLMSHFADCSAPSRFSGSRKE